jgi:hypothetical protein
MVAPLVLLVKIVAKAFFAAPAPQVTDADECVCEAPPVCLYDELLLGLVLWVNRLRKTSSQYSITSPFGGHPLTSSPSSRLPFSTHSCLQIHAELPDFPHHILASVHPEA